MDLQVKGPLEGAEIGSLDYCVESRLKGKRIKTGKLEGGVATIQW